MSHHTALPRSAALRLKFLRWLQQVPHSAACLQWFPNGSPIINLTVGKLMMCSFGWNWVGGWFYFSPVLFFRQLFQYSHTGLSVRFRFQPFFPPKAAFPCLKYAVIILDTVSLDTFFFYFSLTGTPAICRPTFSTFTVYLKLKTQCLKCL